VNDEIEDEGVSNKQTSSMHQTIDLKTINNLKLFKRRTKDFYEENRKKPALFTINSAKVNNQNLKDTSILKYQALTAPDASNVKQPKSNSKVQR
jgi:hypothetical protein